MSTAAVLNDALAAGEGIVRLAPCWVPRAFLMPGGRLKLDPRDLYALGRALVLLDNQGRQRPGRSRSPGNPDAKGLKK